MSPFDFWMRNGCHPLLMYTYVCLSLPSGLDEALLKEFCMDEESEKQLTTYEKWAMIRTAAEQVLQVSHRVMFLVNHGGHDQLKYCNDQTCKIHVEK